MASIKIFVSRKQYDLMNRIESKVRAARRRIILALFGSALAITLFAALLVATVAIAVPAIWVVPVDYSTWIYSWIGGSVVAAVIAAAAYAFVAAPSLETVAVEVDKRFSLRERLSSSLSLPERDRGTEFGEALLTDAEKRASQLEVADRFSIRPSRLGLLPIAVVPVLAIVLLLAEPTSTSKANSMSSVDRTEVKQVQTVAAKLKKTIAQQRKKAEAEGLDEAKEMLERMEAELNKIAARDNIDRKQAMIELNDLKKQLEERRKQLGSSEAMRRVMAQMKGLQRGPGEKVAESIKKGEFAKAKEMVKDLANQMREGKLSEEKKEQLKKQVEQMKQALQKAVEEHEQKKQELQREIEKARQEGRSADAAKMQQQLNEMQQADAQMQRMGQMAEAMSRAAQAMEQGESAEAADALQEMADELGEMQQEMSELEDLQQAMDQLSQSKNQMRCGNCQGGGCQQCQGSGQGMGGMGNGQGKGNGLGAGQGFGDRPESETDTNTYETQVRGQVKKGKAIIAGYADGPNRKGVTREAVKSAVEAALTEESDPIENQTLPRPEQEHARQYFDQLREGE